MKYLCLVYQEEKQEANVPKDVIERAKRDYWSFTEDIKKSGNYVASRIPSAQWGSIEVRPVWSANGK